MSECLTAIEIIETGGEVINNPDGTISVFYLEGDLGLIPLSLTKPCCEALGVGAFFDIDRQECRWSEISSNTCDINSTLKILLNPTGNDGTIFNIDPDENCILKVSFDYLFKIKCESIQALILNQEENSECSPLSAFETLDISMSVDVVSATTSGEQLISVYENNFFSDIGLGNLYQYLLSASGNTGFYVCGDPISGDNPSLTDCTGLILEDSALNTNVYNCYSITNYLLQNIFNESGLDQTSTNTTTFLNSLNKNSFKSGWLHFETTITDSDILAQIYNQKIKLSIKINNSCINFCILIDQIKLERVCVIEKNTTTFLNESPGFELEKIRDNKKSWIHNTAPINRNFNIKNNIGGNTIRQTNYDVNDERLVINSKEIDLDISIASAIETDVWCYITDNPCLLTGNSDTCVICEDNLIRNGNFTENLNYWTITPYSGDWSWSSFNGGSAKYDGVDEGGYLTQNVLTTGVTYNILFDLYMSGDTSCSPYGGVFVYAGLTTYGPIRITGHTHVDINLLASGDTNFRIFGLDLDCDADDVLIYIDNVIVKEHFTCCGDNLIDFTELLTQPLSGITTIEDFEYFMSSELIDAKNRQTISGYPTLRALYDRYMNSTKYCSNLSSKFDYLTMDQFAGLIGNYWVDIVEQVIPATTIWGSVRVYSNTIFDQQKFKYRKYSSLFCDNPFIGKTVLSPINGTNGECEEVEVTLSTVAPQGSTGLTLSSPTRTICNSVCLAQMNSGSEFIGTISIVGSSPFNEENESFINESS